VRKLKPPLVEKIENMKEQIIQIISW